jgi:hypothetical protein
MKERATQRAQEKRSAKTGDCYFLHQAVIKSRKVLAKYVH